MNDTPDEITQAMDKLYQHYQEQWKLGYSSKKMVGKIGQWPGKETTNTIQLACEEIRRILKKQGEYELAAWVDEMDMGLLRWSAEIEALLAALPQKADKETEQS